MSESDQQAISQHNPITAIVSYFVCDLSRSTPRRRWRSNARRCSGPASNWLRRLVDAGFDAGKPALFLWEGVTQFL
jgi:hypothetical protein